MSTAFPRHYRLLAILVSTLGLSSVGCPPTTPPPPVNVEVFQTGNGQVLWSQHINDLSADYNWNQGLLTPLPTIPIDRPTLGARIHISFDTSSLYAQDPITIRLGPRTGPGITEHLTLEVPLDLHVIHEAQLYAFDPGGTWLADTTTPGVGALLNRPDFPGGSRC